MEEKFNREGDERIGSEDSSSNIYHTGFGTVQGGRLGPGIKLVAVVALISALFGALIVAFLVPYMYGNTPAGVYGNGNAASVNSKEIIKVDRGSVSPVTAVAKKLQPSIVNIRIKQSIKDTFHPDVIGGAGSGVIFSQDGYIVTNNHVISNAKDIFVTVGTEEVKGKVVAADKETDIAVIKVDRTGLPAAEFGSTKKIQVGDLAVAIGSPFGFEHTVTSGIISALNRTVSMPDEDTKEVKTYTNLIQTDAPINPGNSGGALSDVQGRIVGINTLIMSTSGVTEGVGFAIPVETVVSVARQLIEKGKASHPYMGILGQNADSGVVVGKDSEIKKGAVVVEVVKGSPADKVGIKAQDVIVALDNTPVESMDEVIADVRQKKVGDKIKITYLRGGKQNTAELTLVEKPRS